MASVLPLLGFSLGSQYLQYRDAVAATGKQTLDIARHCGDGSFDALRHRG